MRSSKSRSRSKQNRPRTLGNIINRVFDSSGPEGKVRGTPQQIIEKYQALARDAQLSNDRVAAENFSQHAEHYTRMLGEAMREMAQEQEQRQQYQGSNQNGGQNGQPNGNGQNGNQYGGQNGNPNGGQNGNQNGNQNGGQNGGQNGQRNDRQGDYRDQRSDQPREQRGEYRDNRQDRSDYRPEFRPEREYRDDRGMDAPRAVEALDVVDLDDAGLVETPEARKEIHPAEPVAQPQPNQRSDRQEGGQRRDRRNFRRDDDRGPRPERAASDAPARVEEPAAQAAPAPVAPAPVAVAEAAPVVEAAKPEAEARKPRAPRKPKPAPEESGPQEAAE